MSTGASIASGLGLLAAFALFGGVFARRAQLLVRLIRMGKPSGIERADDVPNRVRQEARRSVLDASSTGASAGLA